MCGIVGLFIKDKALEPSLGVLTTEILTTMCDRGRIRPASPCIVPIEQ
jgi:glutamate synthase domain-containing protein 1